MRAMRRRSSETTCDENIAESAPLPLTAACSGDHVGVRDEKVEGPLAHHEAGLIRFAPRPRRFGGHSRKSRNGASTGHGERDGSRSAATDSRACPASNRTPSRQPVGLPACDQACCARAARDPGLTPSSLDALLAEGRANAAPVTRFLLSTLAALPVVRVALPLHPLRGFLIARNVSHADAARYLDVSDTTLRAWLSWRARPPEAKRRYIARMLGFAEGDDLFPPSPDTQPLPLADRGDPDEESRERLGSRVPIPG